MFVQFQLTILLRFADIYLFNFIFIREQWNPFIDNRAVEDSDPYTQNDFGNYKTNRGKNAFKNLSFANSETLVKQKNNQTNNRKNLGMSKKITKSIGTSSHATNFHSAHNCEPFGFVTGDCDFHNDHKHKFSHFYKFVKNYFLLYCTFCWLQDNAHTFKRHIDSETHKGKLKNDFITK